MNYSQSTRQRIADLYIGMRVTKAANTSPLVVDTPLFQIVGGRVSVNLLIGEVTTEIENVPTTIQFQSDPTVGADLALSTAATDIDTALVGTLIGLTGTAGGAVLIGQALAPAQASPIVVSAGYIDVLYGHAATGAIKYSLWYVPLDAGAYVIAA